MPPYHPTKRPELYPVSYKKKMPTLPFKNLPDAANKLYETTYQSYLKKGMSKERAAKAAWGAVKQAGYKKQGNRWVKGEDQTDDMERMFQKEKKEHPEFTDDQVWQIVEDHMKQGVEGSDDPADLRLSELMERERKTHPDLSDEELEELVKLHIRELGPPSDEEHKENYRETHKSEQASKNLNKRITFGIDTGIPIFNRFHAQPFGDGGDIKLVGTYLDFEGTTNGWHIDPDEENNITKDQGLVTVRIAHSKDPKEVVGKYEKFWAAEDDGCEDAYGNPLGRHIDFEAVTNPQDPQLRTNILKGWVGDISPGLDAEVFCEQCDEAWGLDTASNKLMKTCEHQDAEGVLRNIVKKEGSIVTEPAFEGRTRFHPTFTFSMAMNQLLSPEYYESEPLDTRVNPDKEGSRQSMTRRQSNKGDAKIMSNNSERKEGTDAARIKFSKLERKALKAMKIKATSEDQDEDEDEEEDEDARIRAALPLIKKHLGNADKYKKMLSDMVSEDEDFIPPDQLQKVQSEDEDLKYATKDEDEDEDRTEDEDAMPSTSPQKRGPGQLPAMKMSREEHAKILEAEKIIAEAKKTELLAAADVVLARQERRKQMTALEDAKKLFEANKDTAGVKAVDERLTVMKAEIDKENMPKTTIVTGAQIPTSTPQLGIPPVEKKPEDFVTQFWNTPGPYNGATAQSFSAQRRKALDAAFKAELVPNLQRRFGRVNA